MESYWNVYVPDTSQGGSFCRYFSYLLLSVSWLQPFRNHTWYLRSANQLRTQSFRHMLCTCLNQVRSDKSRTPRYLKVGKDSSGDPFKHKGGLGVVLFLLNTLSIKFALGTVELHWVYIGPFTNHVNVTMKCRISVDGVIQQDVIGVQRATQVCSLQRGSL